MPTKKTETKKTESAQVRIGNLTIDSQAWLGNQSAEDQETYAGLPAATLSLIIKGAVAESIEGESETLKVLDENILNRALKLRASVVAVDARTTKVGYTPTTAQASTLDMRETLWHALACYVDTHFREEIQVLDDEGNPTQDDEGNPVTESVPSADLFRAAARLGFEQDRLKSTLSKFDSREIPVSCGITQARRIFLDRNPHRIPGVTATGTGEEFPKDKDGNPVVPEHLKESAA